MRRFFTALAAVQLAAVVTQFFLAATGAFSTAPNDEAFQPHRALGGGILVIALLVTITAAVARMPGRVIAMSGLAAGLAILQSVIKTIATAIGGTGGGVVFGLHALGGLAIIAVTGAIIRRARRPEPAPQAP